MAWYRCGGGGLPAGLQSDMDTVLNKKFSTSTTYPPTDWPDNVNLMGPLPEKTASGAIANITDGADGVPIKNWLVTLPASLDGYTEVNGVKAGKNLASGGVYEYNARNMIIAPVYLRAGIYTVSFNRGVNVQYIYIRKGETVSLVGDAYATKSNSTFFTFTADEDTYYYAQLYRTNTSDTWEDYPVTQPQIEVGSTATAYEAYTAPTTYTASLGRTIYGGTADIVTGEGEDENGNAFTFTPITAETALGINNFWADEGDSDVTYRADISLALQALGGGGRGLMMMRPTEPEETEETEETEGLEDELNR